ncbi:MAG: DUF58 domain-containing protein [Blastocatellia bacterium]|nr:DUF58 domain-containing protein [Blastocatellia bacterium]
MNPSDRKQNINRIVREFLITAILLGSSFILATFSTYLVQSGEPQLATFSAILSLVLVLIGGLYIVPKLTKRINFRLFSWNFPYSATTETLFFIVITFIVGFSAVNTGNNLLYLVFSLLLAVLISSGVVSESSLRGIDVSLRFPEHIFANKETILELSVINRKRFIPSFSLTLGIITDADKESEKFTVRKLFSGTQSEKGFGKLAHYAIIPPNGKITQKIDYKFTHRGSYLISGFTVSTKFPFGFLRKTHKKEASGEVLVYPNTKPVKSFSVAVPVLSGWLESVTKGTGTDLYLIRPYAPNDSMRHIDWKATARSRQLMVREHTREDERRVSLIIDDLKYSSVKNFEEKFETAVELTASFAEYFTAQGAEVRLLTPESRTDFGLGPDHLYKMLKILAYIQPHIGTEDGSRQRESVDELLARDEDDVRIVISGAKDQFQAARSCYVIGIDRL